MRLDLALEVNKPDAITSQSSAGAKAYFNKWVESNKLCMMIMRLSMDKTIKNSIPQCDNAKDYLAAVSKKFVVFDKVEKSNYMRLLTTTTYDGTTGIREHIMRMTNLAMRLRDMKVDIPDSYLVWLILESLPDQFSALKTSYNVVKGEWGLDEMTAIVVQHEEMMRKSLVAFFVYLKSTMLIEFLRGYLVVKFISRLEIVDSISKPLTIYNDNSAAVCFSKNNKRSTGLKHMHIKYLVVKEKIQELQTSIVHIATEEMIADPLTKGLPPKVFKEHVTHMYSYGLVESFDVFG
uniref:Reverse transcriptase Ty1/copia-type domain-containing protein n=1 Tax=Fagus sylvatica TaxID=28930 RepID=A0A2N9HJJ0_FAGSY